MEKEEKIIAILLAMIILSLGIAYAMIYNVDGEYYQLVCLNDSKLRDKVFFEGTLINERITRTGNHLTLIVDHNSNRITVFIPNNAGAINLEEKLREGYKIHVRGVVNEFRGKRQIRVQNEQAITIKSTMIHTRADDKYYQLVCLDDSKLRDRVFFEGTLINKRITRTGNHLTLTVDHNSNRITVFIPNRAGAMNLEKKLNEGYRIHVRGVVNEFGGRRQIRVENEQAITIKSSR